MFLSRKTKTPNRELGNVQLQMDEAFEDIVHERWAAVMRSEGSITGLAYDGTLVTITRAKCEGETYDWTTYRYIPCPDHPGVICHGNRDL